MSINYQKQTLQMFSSVPDLFLPDNVSLVLNLQYSLFRSYPSTFYFRIYIPLPAMVLSSLLILNSFQYPEQDSMIISIIDRNILIITDDEPLCEESMHRSNETYPYGFRSLLQKKCFDPFLHFTCCPLVNSSPEFLTVPSNHSL